MSEPTNCRPPGYAQQGSMVLAGTSWTRILPANPNRRAVIFGRGNLGGNMRVAGPAGDGLQITLNDANPTQRIDLDTYGDMVQQSWYVDTFGSPLTVTWSEILCWPC